MFKNKKGRKRERKMVNTGKLSTFLRMRVLILPPPLINFAVFFTIPLELESWNSERIFTPHVCHVSPVKCHVWPVTCHISPVTCKCKCNYLFFINKKESILNLFFSEITFIVSNALRIFLLKKYPLGRHHSRL